MRVAFAGGRGAVTAPLLVALHVKPENGPVPGGPRYAEQRARLVELPAMGVPATGRRCPVPA